MPYANYPTDADGKPIVPRARRFTKPAAAEDPELARTKLGFVALGLAILAGAAWVVNERSSSREPERPRPRPVVTRPAATAAPVQPQNPVASAITVPAPPKPDAEQELARRLAANRDRFGELAFDRALDLEKAGDLKGCLDALSEAEANGVALAAIAPIRVRIEARWKDEVALKDALAAADALAQRKSFKAAAASLKTAREPAERLGRAGELEAAAARYLETEANEEASAWLAEAGRSLDQGDLAAARLVLDRAKARAPHLARLGVLERRLGRLGAVPEGMIYIETDKGTAAGFYARRRAVANRDYKAWLEGLPAERRRPAPWPSTGYPATAHDEPVRWISHEDAKLFAADRGERLPTAEEREQIRRVLGAPEREGELTGKVFNAGFRTVLDAR